MKMWWAMVAVLVTVSGTSAIDVDVHARDLVPGEPVRVVASAPADTTGMTGTFLGRELSFQAIAGTEAGTTWTAWAVIDLDREPGPATVQVVATGGDGRAAAGVLDVVIAAKVFPVENLTVSSKYVEPPKETVERIARDRERLAAIYRTRTATRLTGDPFVRPVDGPPTSVFGTRRLFNDKPRSPHPGLDLRAATGTPVRCSGPGSVALAEELYYSGNIVIVDHGGGLFTLYAHLSRIDIAEGDAVEPGDVLGLSGATGRVTGPHLHWGAKIGSVPFDPRALSAGALFK